MARDPDTQALDIPALRAEFDTQLKQASALDAIAELRRNYVGKKSALRTALKNLRDLPAEQRVEAAKLLNEALEQLTARLDEAEAKLQAEALERALQAEWIDTTLPGTVSSRGALHPVTHVEYRCLEVLREFGFQLVDGPEVERPFYNFDALNIPEHHPARDLQDTFWLEGGLLLRSHTTPVQARMLEQRPPLPIKVVSIGRVYRNEDVDATHLAMFHQFEGFWLEPGINFAHLKGVLAYVAKALYGQDTVVRFKPKYYPYTEPSVGVDLRCTRCSGGGCEACHDAGWLTIMGAGMIHRNVLELFGYDPAEIGGLAFGMGTTRMASQWAGISRVRSLYDNDMRLLQAIYRRGR